MIHVVFNVLLIFVLVSLVAVVSYTSRRYKDLSNKITSFGGSERLLTQELEMLRLSKHQILLCSLVLAPTIVVALVFIDPLITWVCYLMVVWWVLPCIAFKRTLNSLKSMIK